jgi:hypothetical protein
MSRHIRELNPLIRKLSLCAGLSEVHLVLVHYITIWCNHSMSDGDGRFANILARLGAPDEQQREVADELGGEVANGVSHKVG